MNRRRLFALLLTWLPLEMAAKASMKGVSLTLHGLDPRLVEQMRIAAESRNETLEQWLVEVAALECGFHLSDGFAK